MMSFSTPVMSAHDGDALREQRQLKNGPPLAAVTAVDITTASSGDPAASSSSSSGGGPANHIVASFQLMENARDPSVGAVAWPCARYLLTYLAEDPDGIIRALRGERPLADGHENHRPAGPPLAGLRAVELGSGTGIVGIGMHALGCASVTVTDRAHELSLLERNVALAATAATSTTDGTPSSGLSPSSQVKVCELDWKKPASHIIAQLASAADALDLIVACECIYAVDNLTRNDFARTLSALLLHRQAVQAKEPADSAAVRAIAPPPVALVAFEQRDNDIEGAVRRQLEACGCVVRTVRRSKPVPPSEGNERPPPVHYEVWHVAPHAASCSVQAGH